MEIGSKILEENNFEGFLSYMGITAILVMLPASIYVILISLYPQAYMQNLVQNSPLVSEKSKF